MTDFLFDFTEVPDGTQLAGLQDTTATKTIVGAAVETGELVINDGKLDVVTADETLVTIDVGAQSHAMAVRFAVSSASDNMICAVKVTDINNLYCSKYDSLTLPENSGETGLIVWKRVSSSFSVLAEAIVAFADDEYAKLEYNETTGFLTAYKGSTTGVFAPIAGLIDIDPIDSETPDPIPASTKVGFHGRSQGATGLLSAFIASSASAQSVTSINGSDPVSGDTSGNTFETTGFTEAITGVTVGGLACTDVELIDDDDGTFTVPPPVDGEVYPELGVNQSVVVAGETESASLVKPFVLTGYTVTPLDNPELENTQYFTANFDVVPLDTDLLITKTADVTPTVRGGGTTDVPKITPVLHWKRSTGVMYTYQFTINAEGVVPGEPVFRGGPSVIRISGNSLTIDGSAHTNTAPISLSPNGGLSSTVNGRWVARSCAAVDGDLVIDGVTIAVPAVLYVSAHGKLTSTPNGKPVASVR